MKTHRSELGFSAVEVLLLVVIVGLIGFVGWHVVQTHKSVTKLTTATAAQNKQPAASTSSAPAVQNTSDLTTAQQTLDQNDPTTSNSSDSSQLDADLAGLN